MTFLQVVAFQEIEQVDKEELAHLSDKVVYAVQEQVNSNWQTYLRLVAMAMKDALVTSACSDSKKVVADKLVPAGLTPLKIAGAYHPRGSGMLPGKTK
jgi:hypothetical protein